MGLSSPLLSIPTTMMLSSNSTGYSLHGMGAFYIRDLRFVERRGDFRDIDMRMDIHSTRIQTHTSYVLYSSSTTVDSSDSSGDCLSHAIFINSCIYYSTCNSKHSHRDTSLALTPSSNPFDIYLPSLSIPTSPPTQPTSNQPTKQNTNSPKKTANQLKVPLQLTHHPLTTLPVSIPPLSAITLAKNNLFSLSHTR